MKLNKPLALNEQGRRGNQEDSVWPAPGVATAATRTFAVCDGMGGHEAGEVASSTVCAAIGRFVATHPDGPYSDALVEEVVGAAYDMLDSVDRDSATPHRMHIGTRVGVVEFLHEPFDRFGSGGCRKEGKFVKIFVDLGFRLALCHKAHEHGAFVGLLIYNVVFYHGYDMFLQSEWLASDFAPGHCKVNHKLSDHILYCSRHYINITYGRGYLRTGDG